MEFGEMKRNTSNWSNFGMLLRRAGLTASAGLSFTYLFYFYLLTNSHIHRKIEQQLSGRCRICTCRAFSAAMNCSFSRSSTVIRDWFHDTPPTKNWSNSTL